MANLSVIIKRKLTGKGAPAKLEYGELATDGDDLFIGNQDTSVTTIRKNPAQVLSEEPATLEEGALATDGAQLFFGTATGVKSAGGGQGDILLNKQVLDEDITFPNNYNGCSSGPVTIPTGIVVTIPTGARWVII